MNRWFSTILKWLLTCIISFTCMPYALAQSPVGRWLTIDDKTGQKRAIVELTITNDTLFGKIIHVYPKPGDTGLCLKCPGVFKDKPIQGLQMMWGLKDQGHGVWDHGDILEAKTGKIYHAKLRLKGNKLYVRGHIGLVMLGRTQVWTRMESDKIE